jgi:trehalose/maltose hydrolase-like predicted phosphorylase
MQDKLFQFHYTDPKFVGMRCFLGNGYQSTEVSNNLGQGGGLCDFIKAPFPAQRIAGVYSYQNTIPKLKSKKGLRLDTLYRTLNTFGIYPLDPDNKDYPEPEDLDFFMPEQFEQTLDVKRAIVETKAKVQDILLETEVFLSRTQPNFGVMKIIATKMNGSSFIFQHSTKKDPYSFIQDAKFTAPEPGKSLWEIELPDDNYEFHNRGLYHIAQITGLEILDENDNPIPFSIKYDSEDVDKLDLGDAPVWKEIVECETPPISIDEKYRWKIILYFGMFKQSDNETPRFADAPSDEDQGKRAIEGLNTVMNIGYETLLKDHEAAWQQDIWQNLIEVPGADDETQKRIISCFYVMGCTYLDDLAYGNGPNGINGHWWAGRTFWDHDLWVNLGIILWAPALARNFNMLRFNTIDGALQNRKDHVKLLEKKGIIKKLGLQITDGIKYSWESTTSGLERCPNTDTTPQIQEHIVCDVMYGMWLQYTVTHDEQFLENIAFPVAYQCALYLGQRVRKEADGLWHYRYVQCADEFAERKDDNAFTNLYVEKCMGFTIEWCKHFNKEYPAQWDEISSNMKYHFDQKNQRILEHEGYTNKEIKQADTDLITWPLEHDVVYGENGESIRRNNMLFYFSRLPENHIMMSACIFSIIANELGMQEKAWEYFSDQFPHFHPLLSYIPSENPKNDCWPFITGIGGFLSNLIYGFGGIRIRNDGLLFSPRLDPKLPQLIIPHLKFQGIDVRYEVDNEGRNYTLTNLSPSKEFTIYSRNNRIYLPESNEDIQLDDVQGRTEKKYQILLSQEEPIRFVLQEN